MEELKSFYENNQRFADAGLIAISIVILTIWISSQVHDVTSLLSLIALSVALPTLTFDLLLIQNSLFLNKIDTYLDDLNKPDYEPPFNPIKSYKVYVIVNINKVTGMTCAVIGIVTAIWHASWIAGLSFLIIGTISMIIHTKLTPTEKDLVKIAHALGEKKGKDLQEENDELKKKIEEEFEYYD